MTHRAKTRAPAVQIEAKGAQGCPRLAANFICFHELARGRLQRDTHAARSALEFLNRSCADPAFRCVDDPLKGQVIRVIHKQAHIGVGIANFEPFEKARPANDFIGQSDLNEAFLETPHLPRGADEDGDACIFTPFGAPVLDLAANDAGFGRGIPNARDRDFVPAVIFGPERFAEAVFIG